MRSIRRVIESLMTRFWCSSMRPVNLANSRCHPARPEAGGTFWSIHIPEAFAHRVTGCRVAKMFSLLAGHC